MKLFWLVLRYHFTPRLTVGQACDILLCIQAECSRRLRNRRRTEFDRTPENGGAKIGNQLRIRLPTEYRISEEPDLVDLWFEANVRKTTGA